MGIWRIIAATHSIICGEASFVKNGSLLSSIHFGKSLCHAAQHCSK
ncbi:hypothetical protein [Bradyrhizobium sp. SZCCHNRI3043]|nr:hypothetical protein [Bradyrhizobium sp. SZCCHNRI3043]